MATWPAIAQLDDLAASNAIYVGQQLGWMYTAGWSTSFPVLQLANWLYIIQRASGYIINQPG